MISWRKPVAGLMVAGGALALALPGASSGTTPAPPSTPVTVAAPDPRPNIVFITTDDMRVQDLRAMPNVQRLLTATGTSFTTSYAPFPLCCPARASWLTGQYSHNNGVMGNGSPKSPEGGYEALDSTNTVATWLRGAGYQTVMVGKFLNGYGRPKPIVVPPGWEEWHALLAFNSYFSTTLRENTGGVLRTRT